MFFFSENVVTDGEYVRGGYEHWWSLFSASLELAYLPLGLLYAFTSAIFHVLILVGSFIRPDTLIFPRGLQAFQTGHYVFVANVKVNKLMHMFK